ncbi:MAG: gamma-glutamyl-gamma-aminobutyrate hydrolase family protein [Lachnospiraceae bacterium]|jgi:putative glutamine amidotransferase
MKKPVIGVMPLIDEQKSSIWMLPEYLDLIREAGGIPLVLPITLSAEDYREIRGGLNGFLFTGGQDVNPALYGEEKKDGCGELCPERDKLEEMVFEDAWGRDIPILGICRGIQFINVMRGGTLYQDLSLEHPSGCCHNMSSPYDRPCHRVKIQKNSPLFELWKREEKPVNSIHHQAIRDIGADLSCMAVSEDGLTEAVYAPDKRFVWAVQWHPEYSFQKDEDQLSLARYFIEACQ